MIKIIILALVSVASAASFIGRKNLATCSFASLGNDLASKLTILDNLLRKHNSMSPSHFRAHIAAYYARDEGTTTDKFDCPDDVIFKDAIWALTSKNHISTMFKVCTRAISDEEFADKFARYTLERFETVKALKDSYDAFEEDLLKSGECLHIAPTPRQEEDKPYQSGDSIPVLGYYKIVGVPNLPSQAESRRRFRERIQDFVANKQADAGKSG